MSNTYNYGYGTGSQKSLWHYLIFPVDAWTQNTKDMAFEDVKASELKPILSWFMPALVLVAGFTLGLGFFSSLFFYGIQAGILAMMAKFYLKLDDMGKVIELFLNFWCSFLCIAFAMMIIFAVLSIFISF